MTGNYELGLANILRASACGGITFVIHRLVGSIADALFQHVICHVAFDFAMLYGCGCLPKDHSPRLHPKVAVPIYAPTFSKC